MCARSAEVWLPYRRRLPQPRLRLFALPFAGGGASAFRAWVEHLPADVELCAVQWPGRETRFREPAYSDLNALVAAIATALESELDRPYALFGHSMGALIAFQLARELRARQSRPADVLVVSGLAAPHLPSSTTPLHMLPDDQLRSELRRLNGTPAAVLENDELFTALVPMLRADFAAFEKFEYTPKPPLQIPIVACGGMDDPRTTREELAAWRGHTAGGFLLRTFPGDHFYIQSQRDEWLHFLRRLLDRQPTWFEWAAPPPLGPDVVHVWRIDLDEKVGKLSELERLLTPDEQARAGRFHFRKDQERFIVGRGALRELLGNYLDREPGEVGLCYNSFGKPALQRRTADPDLRFNLAHSGATALAAFALGRNLGVDVERIRPDVECLELARRYFSADEQSALGKLPVSEQRRAFFAVWTRKEAYLKAQGAGLSLPLGRFSVSHDEPARLLHTDDDPNERTRWQIYGLEPAAETAGAIVVEGGPVEIQCGVWSPSA